MQAPSEVTACLIFSVFSRSSLVITEHLSSFPCDCPLDAKINWRLCTVAWTQTRGQRMQTSHIQRSCQGNKTIEFFVCENQSGFQQQLEKTHSPSSEGDWTIILTLSFLEKYRFLLFVSEDVTLDGNLCLCRRVKRKRLKCDLVSLSCVCWGRADHLALQLPDVACNLHEA